MAKISDPMAQARPIPAHAGGMARMPVVDPGSIGPGLEAAGAALGAGGEALFRQQRLEEDRVNTLRAEEAYSALRNKQIDLSVGKELGFTSLKGSAAVSRPVLKEWNQFFDDAERQIASGLSNDTQKELFKRRSQVARLGYNEDIMRHLAREGDVYAKEVFDGTVQTEIRGATERWDSPNDVRSGLARIADAVNVRAEQYGWPAEYKKAILQAEQGKVHSSVIGQAIASGNHVYAEEWYKAYRADVDPNTARQLERVVAEGAQKQLTADYNAQFLAQRESKPGLEALEKTLFADKTLDDTRRNIIHGRILSRIDRLEARTERERAQVERQIGKMIDEVNANTLAGVPAPTDTLTPVVELAKGTPLEAQAAQMVALSNATSKFASLSPFAQATEITGAERALREDPTKFDRRVLDAWKQIHERQKEDLKKDPITFAARQGIATPAPLDLSNPLQAADGLAASYSLARSMVAKYDAPFKPLSVPQTELVNRILDGGGWKEKRDYLGQLFQASRGDVRGYSAVMSQIAPDHPVTAVAGEYAAKGRAQASLLMLQGEAILRPSMKADGKPDGGTLIPMPPEQDLRREFDKRVGGAYAGDDQTRNVMYQATRAIYAKLSSLASDKDTKAPNMKRLNEAITLANGEINEHRGRDTVLPYGLDYGQFKDGLRRRIKDAVDAGALDPLMTEGRVYDLPLEAAGDGRYVFQTGNGPLLGKNNRPFLVDFNHSAAWRSSGSPDALEPRSRRETDITGAARAITTQGK